MHYALNAACGVNLGDRSYKMSEEMEMEKKSNSNHDADDFDLI